MSKVQLPPRNAILLFTGILVTVIGIAVFLSYSLVDAAYAGALGRARAENIELRTQIETLQFQQTVNPAQDTQTQSTQVNAPTNTDVTTLATQMLMGQGICFENPGVFKQCYRVDAATGQAIVWNP